MGAFNTNPFEWSAILDGELAERAEAAVLEIKTALMTDTTTSPALDRGAAGHALFFAHHGLAHSDVEDWDRGWSLVEQATSQLSDVESGLFNGFSGIAWTLAHMARLSEDEDVDEDEGEDVDEFLEIDDRLAEILSGPRFPAPADLISGLVGIGVYALARIPDQRCAGLLSRIVSLLEADATVLEGHTMWRTPPEMLPPWQRDEAPEGYYNCGLAHGVAGTIAVLGQIATRTESSAGELVRGAIRFLEDVGHLRSDDHMCPSWVAVGGEPRSSRLAWCYGDPGVAAALLCAGMAQGDDSLIEHALVVARRAARVAPKDALLRDPGLCHGAAGLAHIYNRIWRVTGAEDLHEAARAHYEWALDLLEPGKFFGGVSEFDAERGLVASSGFLEGAAGVGLALLAAINPHPPSWDQVLLVTPVR